MKKQAYIIWNWKEKRPAVMMGNYSPVLIFHTLDQAQAHEAAQKENDLSRDLEIRTVELDIADEAIFIN
jgi:hypothetical protein